jgi:hypothetical protein
MQNQDNTIQISAGSDQDGMSLIYQGRIFEAWLDAQAMPQVRFRISATPGGGFLDSKPITPISFQGATSAATIAQQLASALGLTLENNGVSAMLSSPYYASDGMSALQKLSEDASFNYIVDRGVLAIVATGQSRQGVVPLISAQTGMIGYPQFRSNTVVVQALYNPVIQPFGDFQLQSDITPACGLWNVIRLSYDLEALTPHGKWEMIVQGILKSSTTPGG